MRPARVSQVPSLFFPTMSSLIPRRRRETVSSLFSVSDIDFAHKIGARPPQHSLRGYLCVHLMLQPGRLRCTLSGYVVESLSIEPFPVQHRLLATWLQSNAMVGTWRQSASYLLTQRDQEQFTLALTSQEPVSLYRQNYPPAIYRSRCRLSDCSHRRLPCTVPQIAVLQPASPLLFRAHQIPSASHG